MEQTNPKENTQVVVVCPWWSPSETNCTRKEGLDRRAATTSTRPGLMLRSSAFRDHIAGGIAGAGSMSRRGQDRTQAEVSRKGPGKRNSLWYYVARRSVSGDSRRILPQAEQRTYCYGQLSNRGDTR